MGCIYFYASVCMDVWFYRDINYCNDGESDAKEHDMDIWFTEALTANMMVLHPL